jgi:HAD superfamily hydrolase (TIGR01509 family)
MELIITADDAPFPKEDPKLYEWIAKQMQVEPGEILFVDDVTAFVLAAKKAGLHVVHYTDPESFALAHEH